MASKKSFQKKNGFWSYFLFSKKRNSPELFKPTNTQIAKKNDDSKNPNTVNYPKEQIQRCPGKILPMRRRGCGFHFYMCVDNIRKSDLTRNNKLKAIDANKNNVGNKDTIGNALVKNKTSFRVRVENEVKDSSSSSSSIQSSVFVTSSRRIANTPKPEETFKSPRTDPYDLGTKDNGPKASLKSPKTTFRPVAGFLKHLDPAHSQKSVDPDPRVSSAPKPVLAADRQSMMFIDLGLRKSVRLTSSMKMRRSLFSGRSSSLLSNRTSELPEFSLGGIRMKEILSKLNLIEEKINYLEKKGETQKSNIKNIVDVSCRSAKSTGTQALDQSANKQDLPKRSPSKANTVVIKVCGEDVVVNKSERNPVNRVGNDRENQQAVYNANLQLDVQKIVADYRCKQDTKVSKIGSAGKKRSTRRLAPNISKIVPSQKKVASPKLEAHTSKIGPAHQNPLFRKLKTNVSEIGPVQEKLSSHTNVYADVWRRVSEELKV